MSRWRELIMDFGQIFGTEKSYASSDALSVGSDLSAKRASDLALRRTLEVHFRPLFQRFVYGGEKIACHDLKRVLLDPEYRNRLPADKVHELEDLVDFNKGKAIAYSEFARIVLGYGITDDLVSGGSEADLDSEHGDGSRFRDAMSFVCRNTEPQELVEVKMQTYRCLPPPFFMVGVTLAQIVFHIVYTSRDGVPSGPLADVHVDNPFLYLPDHRREAWRFFSYSLLHQGYVDLILNVLIQLAVGVPLEVMFSWWRVAIVYVMGVMAGSCFHSMADHYAGLAGAAGGAYALLGAHLYAMIRNWRNYNADVRGSPKYRFLCSLPLRIVVLLLIMLPQMGLAVYRRFFLDGVALRIGFAHYLGGLLTGVAISDSFLADHRRKPWVGGVVFSFLFSMLTLVGCTIIINIVWKDYPAEDYS